MPAVNITGFFDYKDKPAYRIDSVPGIPFILEYVEPGEQDWVPCYDAYFGMHAVPIDETRFREMAGDMVGRMRTKL